MTDSRTADPARAGVTVDDLGDGSYDGVILMTTLRTSRLPRDLTERSVPHVLVNRVLDHPESPSCTVDNAAGAVAVSSLVAELGHRRVAAIHGPVATSTGRERALWLRRGLRQRGIALPRKLVRRASFGHDAGMAAAHSLLDESPRPTAIVCANDVLALGALSAARQRGLGVPEDLTIVGFDDIAVAGWPIADLTTVKVDLDLLAETAVEMLLEEIGASVQPSPLRPMERRRPGRLAPSRHPRPSATRLSVATAAGLGRALPGLRLVVSQLAASRRTGRHTRHHAPGSLFTPTVTRSDVRDVRASLPGLRP